MACEKCWRDANFRHQMVDPRKSVSEHYHDLILERENNWCTPEEQNGETTAKADDGSTAEES